jgi:DNA polymerase III epsilon subunit family exonuclease
MQLRLDAADRLVELVEEHGGVLRVEEAARTLFALSRAPAGLARDLLADIVAADSRLGWSGRSVGLAGSRLPALPLEAATYVVVDLETTGLAPGRARICEIGAVRVRGLELAAVFETLVDPAVALPASITALTGLSDADLQGAPPSGVAVARLLDFAGDCVLVAHNARFDVGFLNHEVERLHGRRLGLPVLDTVWLARRLLGGRAPRVGLASLAHFFGTSTEPCHRALPDARATGEILVHLLGLAQERGACSVADVLELAAPRARRVHAKRGLAFGAPERPGVYVFRDVHGQALYVGRARNLRTRLRSYFRSERQRPAVEAALAALDRIEWTVLGSELEAGLEELRLIRELRPPANARSARPDRYVYLRKRGDAMVVTSRPSELGPIRSRRRAERAARALTGSSEEELAFLRSGGALPRLRARLRDLSESLRYEEAAKLRDRIKALEEVVRDLRTLDRLRSLGACLVVPAKEQGSLRGVFVAGGRVACVRTLPTAGTGAILEVRAGLAIARAAQADGTTFDAEAADELLLVGTFLRRPPPELAVSPLDEEGILAVCASKGRLSAGVA